MPFITCLVPSEDYQISWDDVIYGITKDDLKIDKKDTRDTKTVYRDKVSDKLIFSSDIPGMIFALKRYCEYYGNLISVEKKETLYHPTWYARKKNGGQRPIDAPRAELKGALNALKSLFEDKLRVLYHTSAYAYAKGRSHIVCNKKHLENKSRWYLKLDFKDFFPSVTKDFLFNQLSQLFPFCEIIKDEHGKKSLQDALSLCFFKGGLPQGSPISPMLTNLMMIPIDHAISKAMREHTPHILYTRYADDSILTSRDGFEWKAVRDEISKILRDFEAPFVIKEEKTRYGSIAGSNWNLGLMSNKDYQLSIGHERKKLLKTILYCFGKDYKNGVIWSLQHVQILSGKIAYYKSVEKENIEKIIDNYSKKLKIDIPAVIKDILRGALKK
jgi:hypothetical protein